MVAGFIFNQFCSSQNHPKIISLLLISQPLQHWKKFPFHFFPSVSDPKNLLQLMRRGDGCGRVLLPYTGVHILLNRCAISPPDFGKQGMKINLYFWKRGVLYISLTLEKCFDCSCLSLCPKLQWLPYFTELAKSTGFFFFVIVLSRTGL